MSEIDVAVVMVTYKSARLAINSLASIAAQRRAAGLHIRTVVVDNSAEDLPAIERAAQEHGWSDWLTLVRAPRNGGFAYGNNLGIERAYQSAVPDFIYLLNPDTELRPDAIACLVKFMQAHPAVGIAGSGIENPDGSDWPIAFRFPSAISEFSGGVGVGLVTRFLRRWEIAQTMSATAQPIDWICGASMMLRPKMLADIGGLDENYFLYFEETDLCVRAKKAGYETWYVPQSRVMHIVGQSTKVTERNTAPKRLPQYWFASRRRYFAVHAGIAHAMFIDCVAIAAYSLGWFKNLALGRLATVTPHFVRDLISNSVMWSKNRDLPPLHSFRPGAQG